MNKKRLLELLKERRISHSHIPDEFVDDLDVIRAERSSNSRIITDRGYDVIKNCFFVKESFFYGKKPNGDDRWKERIHSFDSFSEYYSYLDGASLFENSCYYKIDDSKIIENSLDEKTIQNIIKGIHKTNQSLTNDKIYNYQYGLSDDEKAEFDFIEHHKRLYLRRVATFNSVSSLDDLVDVCRKFRNSRFPVDLDFFFWNFIFKDENIWDRFEIIMKYISSLRYLGDELAKSLCFVYGADRVFEAFIYNKQESGARSNFYKHRSRLKKFIEKTGSIKQPTKVIWYFDKKTHFFCEEKEYGNRWDFAIVYRYFSSFDEFIKYKGDICDCDLSKAYNLRNDLSFYKSNEKTIYPLTQYIKPGCIIKKGYQIDNGWFHDDKFFYVKQEWIDKNGNILKEYEHRFEFFFDFVSFLDKDLSEAALLKCDGLKNINDFSDLKLDNAQITGEVAQKAGTKQTCFEMNKELLISNPKSEKNESDTELLPSEVISDITSFDNYMLKQRGEMQENERKISYISDLHLLHRIQNSNCKTENDVFLLLDRIAEKITSNSDRIILIAGDTSSDFVIFELFLEALKKHNSYHTIVFVLGNHELWPFEGKSLEEISSIYKETINKYGMYLLDNSILYEIPLEYYRSEFRELSSSDFKTLSKKELRSLFSSTRTIIFGGSAFSGYNKAFNAEDGIYLSVMDRKQEIYQTKAFEKLYKKVENTLSDKNVVILTHTPKSDWCSDPEPFKNFVYVNGHNHRNYFYDDGEYRVYSDNQVGYHGKLFGMKYFYMNNYYDTFSDYKDGIYSITRNDYINFYRGKCISLNFNRDVNEIIMLKKNNYYCFIHSGKTGNLSILNGGSLKKLEHKDVHYYYENMDRVISIILAPLNKYTKFQSLIADSIKSIGGTGDIHGCIIDIDGFNHIYVNPTDLKITAYYALNIVYKFAYQSVPALLESKRPDLYIQYKKLLQNKSSNPFAVQKRSNKKNSKQAIAYLDTDIYVASRQIKKMQKLYSSVLSVWIEPEKKMLKE